MPLDLNHTFKENQRLNLGWRPVGLVYLAYALVMSVVNPIAAQVLHLGPLPAVLLAYAVSAVVCLALVFKLGRTPASLGLGRERFLKQMLAGWGLAFLFQGFVFLANYLLDGLTFTFNNHFSPLVFLLLLLGFTIQGFMEEFLLRALIQGQLTIRYGVLAGILSNSLFFALGHLTNPNSSIISVVNTFLMAVFFSLIFYYHDNLWIAAGIHAGWNFILGPVLGIAVSGFDLPTNLLNTSINFDKIYLNGGQYGFEASYLVTVIIVISIAAYWYMLKRKNRS